MSLFRNFLTLSFVLNSGAKIFLQKILIFEFESHGRCDVTEFGRKPFLTFRQTKDKALDEALEVINDFLNTRYLFNYIPSAIPFSLGIAYLTCDN